MFIPLVFRILDFDSKEIESNFDNIVNLFILFIDPFISGTLTTISVLFKQKHGFISTYSLHLVDKLFLQIDTKISFAIPRIGFIMFVISNIVGYSLWNTYMIVAGLSVIDEIMERFCYMICYIQLTIILCYYIGTLMCIFLR